MLFLNGQQKIAETLLKGKAKLKKQQIPKKKDNSDCIVQTADESMTTELLTNSPKLSRKEKGHAIKKAQEGK
jgi:hypothetical protein